ncbi:hypothetical protein PVK06_002514 [Gossypium arboreum]|uniref:Uncharacterized protein n=1 Tax=Gossypium arboreum TaxID=29729 RepID=A0ABR0R3T6_GOSAR|nr:hypothetical protein PVK06_002514 [Gossypium arboreum]
MIIGAIDGKISRSKEYWPIIDGGTREPKAGAVLTNAQQVELEVDKLKELKELKEKNYLFQAIDRSILKAILCKDTPKQILDS